MTTRPAKKAITYQAWVVAGHPKDATIICPSCGSNHFASAHLHPVRGLMRSCVVCRNVFARKKNRRNT